MSSRLTEAAIRHCQDKHRHEGRQKVSGCIWRNKRFCDTHCDGSTFTHTPRKCRKMCRDFSDQYSVHVVKDLVNIGFDSIIPALVSRNPDDWQYDVSVIDEAQYLF